MIILEQLQVSFLFLILLWRIRQLAMDLAPKSTVSSWFFKSLKIFARVFRKLLKICKDFSKIIENLSKIERLEVLNLQWLLSKIVKSLHRSGVGAPWPYTGLPSYKFTQQLTLTCPLKICRFKWKRITQNFPYEKVAKYFVRLFEWGLRE